MVGEAIAMLPPEDSASFRHLANKLAQAREKGDQEAMDLVVAQVDDWLLAGQGQEVDKLIKALVGKKLTVGVNLAVLSAVHPRRQDLRRQEPPSPLEEQVYRPFFEQAEGQLKAQQRDTVVLLRAWR